MDFLTKIEALKKNKPELYAELLGEPTQKKKTVKHGEKFETVPQVPVQISLKEAKRIIKANRPPRKPVSEEQKARMIANLQKGRETLAKRRAMLKGSAPTSTQFTVKEKQVRQVKPIAEKPESRDSELYEEFLNLKRQQASLKSLQQKRSQSKYGAL